jgi:hypothetical protein
MSKLVGGRADANLHRKTLACCRALLYIDRGWRMARRAETERGSAVKRMLCVLLVGGLMALSAGCSVMYSSVQETDGKTISEVGLFGLPPALGVPEKGGGHGLLPLWRHTEPE